MSSLNPQGKVLKFNGEERELLFTLNAVGTIQEEFKQSLDQVINQMLKDRTNQTLIRILRILLNDEAEKRKYFENVELKRYEDKEVGWIMEQKDFTDCMVAIMEAYGVSLPETDEDNDPN